LALVYVGSKTGLDVLENRKHLTPAEIRSPDPAAHYNNYDILARFMSVV